MSDVYVVGVDMTKFQKAGTGPAVDVLGAQAALMALDDCGLKIGHGVIVPGKNLFYFREKIVFCTNISILEAIVTLAENFVKTVIRKTVFVLS